MVLIVGRGLIARGGCAGEAVRGGSCFVGLRLEDRDA